MSKSVRSKISALENKIFLFRGEKVMLDMDLAKLYGVETKVLNQAVKRNIERFPKDFMFQLTKEEAEFSRSQIVTLKQGKNIKYYPYVFTEQGVAMLSSVLRSKRAIQVNVAIMRTFVKLRKILSSHKELEFKLSQFDRKVEKQDKDIRVIFEILRRLMSEPETSKEPIGFHPRKRKNA